MIAGQYKRRVLMAPRGHTTRPIPDRLKESLFSILQPWLPGARVLDLCSGSGAMGIEALSRGAAWVTFVDSSSEAIRALKHNLKSLRIESGFAIFSCDVDLALRRLEQAGETFDLVFFDPPYASDLYLTTLPMLGTAAVLNSGAIVMVMHHAKNCPAQTYGRLQRGRELRQGENQLSFYVLD